MTDRDVFEKFMEWLGMAPIRSINSNGDCIVEYREGDKWCDFFSSVGYDEFYASAIFDKKGNLKKGSEKFSKVNY